MIDKQKIVKYLKGNSKEKSSGLCCRFVRLALESGGALLDAVPHAKHFGDSLKKHSDFVLHCEEKESPHLFFTKSNLDFCVVIFDEYKTLEGKHHNSGHTCIAFKENDKWKFYSDFVQWDVYGGSLRKLFASDIKEELRPKFQIWALKKDLI